MEYLTSQATDSLSSGKCGEWFRDDDGFRYGAAIYYVLTAGLIWKLNSWLMIRPELRYDWSHTEIASFDAGQRTYQILLGLDAVV